MEHTDPVEALFARVNAAKVPMYLLCDRAGVARSTPSRWKSDKNGATVATVAALDAALSNIMAERAQEQAAA